MGALQRLRAGLAHLPQKRLLAQTPGRSVPDAVIDRGKTGFGIPINRWLSVESPDLLDARGWARRVAAHFGSA